MMTSIIDTTSNGGWDQFVDLERGEEGIIRIEKGRMLDFWGVDKVMNDVDNTDERWLDEGWMAEVVIGVNCESWSSWSSWGSVGDVVINPGEDRRGNIVDIGEKSVLGINWITMIFYYGYNIMYWIISG